MYSKSECLQNDAWWPAGNGIGTTAAVSELPMRKQNISNGQECSQNPAMNNPWTYNIAEWQLGLMISSYFLTAIRVLYRLGSVGNSRIKPE